MISMPDRLGGRAVLAAIALSLLSLPAAAAPGEDAMKAALEALARQDGIAAEVELKRALEAGVPRAAIAASMGEAEFLQGEFEEARIWLEPGEFTPETSMRGFQMLARLEMSQGNLEPALAAFNRALEGNPGTAELWVDIARLHYLSGQHLLAIEAAGTALERGPKDPRAIEFKALLVRDSEGLEAALPWFARGLEAAPDDLSLLAEYASTLGELGRAKDMLAITRRMIELDGKNPRAFYLQAVLAARAGKDHLARRLMARTGLSLEDIPAALMLEGVLELRAGNPALAVEAFATLSRSQPDNMRAHELFARALLENGEATEVAARYAPFVDRTDASPYLMTLVGRAYEELGDRAAAAPFLDRAAATPGFSTSALVNSEQGDLLLFRFGHEAARLDVGIVRIREQVSQGALAEAEQTVASLRERYGGSADFLTLAGDVALTRGDAVTALAEYETVARIRRSQGLTAKMVVALKRSGRDGEARALALDYLRQHPLDRDSAWLAAKLAEEAGDWRQAKLLAEHLRRLAPDSRDPQLLTLLALAQLGLGEAEAGLRSAQDAYRMQPMNGRSAAVLAMAMRQTGGDAAQISWLEAKARQAGNPS
jgi:tetratricopeptide (TPR) repeat protein